MARAASTSSGRRSPLARILRAVLLAIFVAFLLGLVVGTLLRRQLDRPVRYMSARPEFASFASVAGTADPGDIRYALPRVLVTGDHEEQVG